MAACSGGAEVIKAMYLIVGSAGKNAQRTFVQIAVKILVNGTSNLPLRRRAEENQKIPSRERPARN